MLRSVLSAAMREELVTRNVAGAGPGACPAAPKAEALDRRRGPPVPRVRPAHEDPLYAGYVLMLVLGLRRGELLGLAWEDLDLDAGEARIAWQVQRVGGQLVRRADQDPLVGRSTAAA